MTRDVGTLRTVTNKEVNRRVLGGRSTGGVRNEYVDK